MLHHRTTASTCVMWDDVITTCARSDGTSWVTVLSQSNRMFHEMQKQTLWPDDIITQRQQPQPMKADLPLNLPGNRWHSRIDSTDWKLMNESEIWTDLMFPLICYFWFHFVIYGLKNLVWHMYVLSSSPTWAESTYTWLWLVCRRRLTWVCCQLGG